MSKIIISIGIPGSGKTSFMKPFAKDNNFTYICLDDIREELCGDPRSRTKELEVLDLSKERTLKSLSEKVNVVFDATFADVEFRHCFLAFLKENNIKEIEGIYFNTDLDLAKERNRNRDRFVPEAVLDRMHNSLLEYQPSKEEGFSKLFNVVDGNLIEI